MSQSGSFIPQQSAAPKHAPRPRRVYIIGYFIYTVFFGVLLVIGALLVWGWQLTNELEAQQQALSDERSSFKESDMILVKETDNKLALIEYVLNQQPAITRVLNALEETTVSSIQITDFKIASDGMLGDTITLTYTGLTDTFDAVMIQRATMAENPILANAKITNVSYSGAESDDEDASSSFTSDVSYSVTLEIPVANVQYQGLAAPAVSTGQSDTGIQTVPVAEDADTDSTFEGGTNVNDPTP